MSRPDKSRPTAADPGQPPLFNNNPARRLKFSWRGMLLAATLIIVVWELQSLSSFWQLPWWGTLLTAGGVVYGLMIIHEGGHLLTGLIVGNIFVRCIIGPINLNRTSTGLKFSFSPDLLRGSSLTIPANRRHLRLKMSAVAVGGPAANLLVGLLAGGLLARLWSAPLSMEVGVRWLAVGLGITCFLSLLLALANLLPLNAPGGQSDGTLLKLLISDKTRGERWAALMALVGLNRLGIRPSQWPPEWLDLALSVEDNTPECVDVFHRAYQWALDQGRIDDAGTYLQMALARVKATPKSLYTRVMLEAVYYTARYQGPVVKAREYLARLKGENLEAVWYLRACSAILWAEGASGEAAATANQGLAALAKMLPTGALRLAQEELAEMAGDPKNVARDEPVPG